VHAPDDSTYGPLVTFSLTLRRALLGGALTLALALPATALGHGRTLSASTMSIKSAAKVCKKDTPRAEKRLRAAERLMLGSRHAAEHAAERAQSRRQACTSNGRLKKSFVTRVRAQASVKKAMATGPPSDVGQWGPPIDLPGIVAIHTTLLPNGKVLFFYNNPEFGDEARGRVMVWDPATQTGVRRDVPGNIWCAGQIVLADGRVLVVGGNLQYQTDTSSFKGLNQIWIFDPSTETWLRGPDMEHGRWYPTATKLPDGEVLITAGWDESGKGAASNNQDLEVYTPAADGHGPGTVRVVAHRDIDYYPHQYVLPDGRVILAGPRDVDTAFINPGGWSFTDIPDLNINRDYGYGSGVLLPGPPSGSTKVLLVGGANGDANLSTATTEQFDAANPSAGWTFKAPLPESRRNVNTVILPDGDLLAVGGNNDGASNGYHHESVLYTPATNTWTPVAAQGQPRGYHSTAILLPDARVLSAGDDTTPGGGWENDIAEIYSPPYLFKGPRPSITSAPRAIKWGSPFTIGTTDQVSRAVLIAPGATTHANDMNQRHVELAISPTAGGIQAIAPPTANVAPPGPYMLFLLNAQGVPSVSRFVQVGDVFDQGGSAAPGAPGGSRAGRPLAGAKKKLPVQFLNPKLKVGKAWVSLAVTLVAPLSRQVVVATLGRPGPGRGKVNTKKLVLKKGKKKRVSLRVRAPRRHAPLRLRLQLKVKPAGGSVVTIKRNVLKAGPKVALRVPKTGKSAKALG
jgi:Galactose oxidase-like, Early set domain/Kelch motif